MSAESLVTGLNVLYLAPMGLVSLIGTATLLKLISVLRREHPRPLADFDLEVEDA